MQTDRLFTRDSHMREFDAQVLSCAPGKHGSTSCRPDGVLSEGGGQPGDTGTLSGVRVTDTHEAARSSTTATADARRGVHGALDWERLDLMQQHWRAHSLRHRPPALRL